MAGYDNFPSLSAINGNTLTELEEYIKENKYIIDDLACCSADVYKKKPLFRLLPGHKTSMLQIPRMIAEMNKVDRPVKTAQKAPKKPDPIDRLIALLNAYPTKIELDVRKDFISKANIVDRTEEKKDGVTTIKYKFFCPLCDRKIPVKFFKNRWYAGNASTHLKKHKNGEA